MKKKPAPKKPAKKAPPQNKKFLIPSRRPKPKPARKTAKPPKQVQQKSDLPSAKQAAFLAAYAECGNISAAARAAEVVRQAHYDWMATDATYPDRFQSAHENAMDLLEEEARRRAVQGTDKPVFYKGEECGAIREYSDTLLMFLLNGGRPQKFRQNAKVEHTGPNNGPIAVALQNLSDDQLEQLAAIARAASQPGSDRS